MPYTDVLSKNLWRLTWSPKMRGRTLLFSGSTQPARVREGFSSLIRYIVRQWIIHDIT